MLQRYLDLRLDGEIYPLGGNVKEIFDTLLGTSSWYLKTIGLQLVAETFAVWIFADCVQNLPGLASFGRQQSARGQTAGGYDEYRRRHGPLESPYVA